MQGYARYVLTCMNCLLREVGVATRLTALYHITPELVLSMAEWHYDRRISDLILFLEHYLSADLRADSNVGSDISSKPYYADAPLLSHLKSDEFRRGDLFTVLSAAELVYSVHRHGSMPVFPRMTNEVCDLLRRRRDTMVAHGNFLRENMLRSGGSDCARDNLRRCTVGSVYGARSVKSSGNPAEPAVQHAETSVEQEILQFKQYMYDYHLKPLIEKYYMNYQSPEAIRYTIARLQRKLDHVVESAVHQQKQNIDAHKREVERQVARQFDRALQVERMNLRDEAKWRADERKYKRDEAARAASSVAAKREIQAYIRTEQQQNTKEKVLAIRREEIAYVNHMRAEAETSAFRAIYQSSRHTLVGNSATRDYGRATQHDINERLRLYQGAEFLYNDGVYSSHQ